ncbi:MAG: hypothetical protein HQ475_04335 [SAR202 cluster bacterium]|nr:hypothetical protein [SAR202 cluster bacterium]
MPTIESSLCGKAIILASLTATNAGTTGRGEGVKLPTGERLILRSQTDSVRTARGVGIEL